MKQSRMNCYFRPWVEELLNWRGDLSSTSQIHDHAVFGQVTQCLHQNLRMLLLGIYCRARKASEYLQCHRLVQKYLYPRLKSHRSKPALANRGFGRSTICKLCNDSTFLEAPQICQRVTRTRLFQYRSDISSDHQAYDEINLAALG